MSLKRLLLSLIIIGAVGVVVVNLSSAFFSDTETSTGNTFQAGELDLLVDGQNDPTAIVDVDDLKPGDDVFEDKLLTIQNNAFLWLHLIEFESGQGTSTESEELEEDGTPKHDIENFLTYDLFVDSATIIASESAIHFPDVFSCWIPLGEIEPDDTTVTQSFHFDEEVTNWAQGDTLVFSEQFYAAQSRNNPGAEPPDLGNERSWSSELKKCVTDITGQHLITFTCTSGCSGDYPHTMDVTSMNNTTGDFSGTGFYNPNNAFTWNVTGNTMGAIIEFDIVYTGLNPGYTVEVDGTMNLDGTSFGTAISSSAQTFTWTMD